MPQIVVIDSNIWLAEQMLRHSAGSALRFFLRTSGARVAIPEVVRLEVVRHLTVELQKLARDIQQSHGRLLRHLGALKELVLPSSQELEDAARRAFESARIDMLDVPFSIESARASFEKCIAGDPPSGPKDQQFKDGVIWADCVRLAADNPVVLVSADKAFFRNRQYENALATNLATEAQATKFGIKVVHELAALMELVRTPVSVDYRALGERMDPHVWNKLKEWVGQQGFVVGDLISGKHRLFATDDPAQAHLEFELSYQCVHPDEREGTLVFRGEASFSPATGAVGPVDQKGDEFTFTDVNNKPRTIRSLYMVGAAILGHRTVRHEVKVPLDAED
jgi:hypothetical protein